MIIKNGNIHVGNGKILEGYDVLIEKGIIKKVTKNIYKDDDKIIDGKGMEVFPGFIDPVSSYGCMDIGSKIKDHDEISDPITPEANIKYAFNHDEILLEELYKVGITAIGAAPGDKNVIGGQMAVYNTWGENSSKMLLKESVALKGSVVNSVKETYGKRDVCPMTKMGIFNELEKFLLKSKMALNSSNGVDDINNIIGKVINKEISLFITAVDSTEIKSLINIINKYDIKLVICGGYQADRCLDIISSTKASIVVGEQVGYNRRNYNNTNLYKIAQSQEDGLLISFSLTGDNGPEGKIKYLWNAIEFYKAGVEEEEVLKMMTLNPAKMLGIDNKIGTIEEGKQADIVIYSNNPIKYYNSKLKYTIINGEIAYHEGGKNICC
ncbi:MAG: amidohydrolase family protein [Tissierellia bacterium]|nr:amidohydrolase family protein [Tissierellia bacterium]